MSVNITALDFLDMYFSMLLESKFKLSSFISKNFGFKFAYSIAEIVARNVCGETIISEFFRFKAKRDK